MKGNRIKWRVDVLSSKIRGKEVLKWSYILRELFKSHTLRNSAPTGKGC